MGGLHNKTRFIQGCLMLPFKPPGLVRENSMEIDPFPHNYYPASYIMVCHVSFPETPKGKVSAFNRTVSKMMRLILPDLTSLNDLPEIVQNTVILGKAQSH